MRVNQAPLCAAALHLARDDISIAQTAALGPREIRARAAYMYSSDCRARDIKYISFKTPRRELGAAHSSQTAELEIIYKYARARELGGGAHSSDCSARPVREK